MDPTSSGKGRGLCATCRHSQEVPARTGASYTLCLLSRLDPAFPRYPPLPVLACPGFEPEENRSGDENE